MNIKLRGEQLALAVLFAFTFACAPAATSQAGVDSSTVTAADLQLHPDQPIEYVIQRKVSGITVSKTQEGNLLLQIRGAMSSEGKGDPRPPLYVLNGMTIAPALDGSLPPLNREDIATIKVLKGADAAIYGIEGANGVIVITTKTGAPVK